jgi:hypothetical protein
MPIIGEGNGCFVGFGHHGELLGPDRFEEIDSQGGQGLEFLSQHLGHVLEFQRGVLVVHEDEEQNGRNT